MLKNKAQLKACGVDIDSIDLNMIVTQARPYTDILIKVLDKRIHELSQSNYTDFDKDNYSLKRSFKDGGAHHLTLLKELIKNV